MYWSKYNLSGNREARVFVAMGIKKEYHIEEMKKRGLIQLEDKQI